MEASSNASAILQNFVVKVEAGTQTNRKCTVTSYNLYVQ